MPVHQGNDRLHAMYALQAKAAAIRQGELQKAFRQLGRLSDAERQTVAELAAAITDRILVSPCHRLQASDTDRYERVLRDLFALDGFNAATSPE